MKYRMTQHVDASTDRPTNEQAEYVQEIGTIVADPNEIIKHLEKNIRNDGTLYTPRKFRVGGIRSDDPCTISAKVDPRDEDAYYDDTPHPVWISPKTFIEGYDRDSDRGAPRFIPRHETRSIVRDEFPELDEDSDEFEQRVDEWQEEALEYWRQEARSQLKDEIKFEFRAVQHHPEFKERTISHTVNVEYMGDSDE